MVHACLLFPAPKSCGGRFLRISRRVCGGLLSAPLMCAAGQRSACGYTVVGA